MDAEKEHAHALLDQIPHDQMNAAVRFLEFLLIQPVDRALATAPIEDEAISEEEELSVARSKEWFKHNSGFSLEQVATELGLNMEQIRNRAMGKDPLD